MVYEVQRVLRSLNIDISNIKLREDDSYFDAYADIKGFGISIELDPRAIAWIIVNRLLELRPELVGDKVIRITINFAGSLSTYVFDTELIKRIGYFNGAVLRILIPHGFYITDVKTRIDPVASKVELLYSVKSIEKVVSRTMLSRLAYECVREIKKMWPGRIVVRLRAGLITEGRAEA